MNIKEEFFVTQQLKDMTQEEKTEDEMVDTQEYKSQQYNAYVESIKPSKSLPLQMIKAFICGGSICLLGQFILHTAKEWGASDIMAGAYTSVILVLMSVVLTGLSFYQIIADWGGAGALVPITGFANSICSPALEYKPEGQVYGIGVKIFTIAGPVILYGIVSSWCFGLLYYLTGFQGL